MMKNKIKYDLIIWLWIILLFPISSLVIVFLFNVLAIILGPTTKLDLIAYIYLFSQLLFFLGIFFLVSIKWKNYMILDIDSLKIYKKGLCEQKIDYQKIVNIEYCKTPFLSIPSIYFSNGNEIRFIFIDEQENENVFKTRIFYRDLRIIEKYININIKKYKSSLN